jgi:hypothetical protein
MVETRIAARHRVQKAATIEFGGAAISNEPLKLTGPFLSAPGRHYSS